MIEDRGTVFPLRQCGRIAASAPRSQACLSRVHGEHAVRRPHEMIAGQDNRISQFSDRCASLSPILTVSSLERPGRDLPPVLVRVQRDVWKSRFVRRVGPKLRFEGKAAIGNRCKPVVCALVRIAKNVPVKDLETGLGARHNHHGVGTRQARNLPEGLAEIGNAEIRVKKAISAVTQCAAIAAIEARAGDIRNLARRSA